MKKHILTIMIASGFLLSACDNNQQMNKNIKEAVNSISASGVTVDASSPLAGLLPTQSASDIQISQNVKDKVFAYIQAEVKAGRLKPEDIKQEDVIKLLRMLSEAERLANETTNQITGAAVAITDLKDSYVGDGAKELGELIKKNLAKTDNKPVTINEIRRIFESDFYAVYLNDSPELLFTNKNNDFYISMVNDNQRILKDNQLRTVENVQQASIVYKKFVETIDKNKLISIKFGKGENSLYIFTDPDCPFCKKQDEVIFNNLTSKDNVTIYYVMNPLTSIHPEALGKAAQILCSPTPAKSWISWQHSRGSIPVPENYNKEKCEDKVLEQMAYSEILGFFSTPTNINGNGVLIDGTIENPEHLRKLLKLKI